MDLELLRDIHAEQCAPFNKLAEGQKFSIVRGDGRKWLGPLIKTDMINARYLEAWDANSSMICTLEINRMVYLR